MFGARRKVFPDSQSPFPERGLGSFYSGRRSCIPSPPANNDGREELEMRIRLLLFIASLTNPASQGIYRRLVRWVLRRFGVDVRGLPLWISSSVYFDYRGGIILGDRCVISNGVYLLTHDYSMDVVAERRFGVGENSLVRSAPIEVGDQAFIGMNSMVLPGVTIGPGAVVGAGSVVTRDVPADTVVAGNPATVVSDTDAYWARSHSKFRWEPRRA